MLLKRIYQTPEGWAPKRNVKQPDGKLLDGNRPEGAVLNLPPLDHVRVVREGKPRHLFSTRLVATAIHEGWMTLSKGKIILHTKPHELAFRIEKVPGHYCCHCGERMSGEVQARKHVLLVHAGVGEHELSAGDPELKSDFHAMLAAKKMKSPDKGNPAGYCQANYYDCVKVA